MKKIVTENVIPLFLISNSILLPKVRSPFIVIDERYKRLIADSMNFSNLIGVFSVRRAEVSKKEGIDIYPVGCAGKVVSFSEAAENVYSVLIQGVFRAKLIEIISDEPYSKVRFEILPDILPPPNIQESLKREIIEKSSIYLSKIGESKERLMEIVKIASAMPFDEVVNWAIFLHPLKFAVKLELLKEDDLESRATQFIREVEKDISYLEIVEKYRPLKPSDPNVN